MICFTIGNVLWFQWQHSVWPIAEVRKPVWYVMPCAKRYLCCIIKAFFIIIWREALCIINVKHVMRESSVSIQRETMIIYWWRNEESRREMPSRKENVCLYDIDPQKWEKWLTVMIYCLFREMRRKYIIILYVASEINV